MSALSSYLFRLFPANPIMRRVVENGGKRRWHLMIRCAYLGLLVVYVTFALAGGAGVSDLAKLTRQSMGLFQWMSYVQLGLVALLAPIFTAGAITQERDSQTYDILLATPLTNAQIVVGSLFSRLFFIFALLLSGVPIFAATQIFGGVAIKSIVYSFLIAAVTALLTGSMAMAMATFKIGTRRTILGFYLIILLYLGGFVLLGQVPFFQIAGATAGSHTSWFTALNPFLALRVILNDRTYVPPDVATLPGSLNFWPLNWWLTSPQTFYIAITTLLSVVMVLPSIALLRWLAQSTLSLQAMILRRLNLSRQDRTRTPRSVWSNPVAWREARTKGSAVRSRVLRYGIAIIGLSVAVTLLVMHGITVPPPQYITGASFDPSRRTLYIESDTPSLRSTSALSPSLSLKVDGIDVTDSTAIGEALSTPHAVKASNTEAVPGSTTGATRISSLELTEFPTLLGSAQTRDWLLGLVLVEFAIILLIVTNAAASTVTREKEDGTLDLLLSTPITSRFYIWGKLRGLVAFVLPLVAVPAISVLLFVIGDMVHMAASGSDYHWLLLPESVVIMPGVMIIAAAFAAILGMQMSLRCRTTVWAVMSSVLIIAGTCAALGGCGYSLISNSSHDSSYLVLAISTVSPFTLLSVLLNPYTYGGPDLVLNDPNADQAGARVVVFIASLVVISLYAVGVWTLYKSMVKNFDMTIRRQSR